MKSLIVSIILLITTISIHNYISSYDKEELHTYLCYKKYNTSDRNGKLHFYMVLKSEQNYMFDIKVNPSTYFTTEENSKVKFNLKPSVFDPNYNTCKGDFLKVLFLLNILVLLFSIAVFITNVLFQGIDNESDW